MRNEVRQAALGATGVQAASAPISAIRSAISAARGTKVQCGFQDQNSSLIADFVPRNCKF
jgi:hypothetical protein